MVPTRDNKLTRDMQNYGNEGREPWKLNLGFDFVSLLRHSFQNIHISMITSEDGGGCS